MSRRRGALALLVLLGCRGEPTERKLLPPERVVDAAALDSLAGERPVEVSVSGRVAEAPDGRSVLLDDGTGLVRVVLPDTVRVAVGTRFLAQGLLRREAGDAGGVYVEAEAWLYDSTAAPVRSP
jgi:hypothetical protein